MEGADRQVHTLKRAKLAIFIGLLPALLIYVGIAIIPIGLSMYYSFFDWNGLTDKIPIGFDNFIHILKDPIFWKTVKNNIIMMLTGILGQIPLGLLLALLLNRSLRGIKIFRTIGFLPVVLSSVIVSLTWGMMYGTESGLINGFLGMIGLESLQQNWLGDPSWSMWSISLTYIWQNCGLYMVIFLAALQNVPNEVNEAAALDGATGIQRTLHVTLPILKPTILVTVVFSISNSFRVFDLIFVMTSGGPAHNTEVMTIYMYNNTFLNLQYGLGSAVSIFILLFSLIVVMITNVAFSSKE